MIKRTLFIVVLLVIIISVFFGGYLAGFRNGVIENASYDLAVGTRTSDLLRRGKTEQALRNSDALIEMRALEISRFQPWSGVVQPALALQTFTFEPSPYIHTAADYIADYPDAKIHPVAIAFVENFVHEEREKANSHIYDEAVSGSRQIADALEQTKDGRRRVLLQFGTNYCGPCRMLHELMAKNSEIQKLMAGYVPLLIDVNGDHNSDVDKQYGHPTGSGVPVMVVLDSDGKLLATKSGDELCDSDKFSPQKIMAFLQEWTPKDESGVASAK